MTGMRSKDTSDTFTLPALRRPGRRFAVDGARGFEAQKEGASREGVLRLSSVRLLNKRDMLQSHVS